MVFVYQIIDDVERKKLVVGIVFAIVMMVCLVVLERTLSVLLILELEFILVLFCLFLEEGIPSVNLVECLVEQVLLVLAIDTILFRNLLFISYL